MEPTTPAAPPPTPAPSSTAPADGSAKIVYVLYLVSLVLGVTALVGVIIAYVKVGEAPQALRTHYRFQIRTFWISILYGLVALVLSFAVIGVLAFAFVAVWLIVRCVKGLRYLGRGEAYPDPATWLW